MKNKLKKGVGLLVAWVIIKWTLIGTVGAYLVKTGQWSNWYLAIFPVLAIGVMGIRKYRKRKASIE